MADDVCALCLEPLASRTTVELTCKHAFHASCFVHFLKHSFVFDEERPRCPHVDCPMCRRTLLSVVWSSSPGSSSFPGVTGLSRSYLVAPNAASSSAQSSDTLTDTAASETMDYELVNFSQRHQELEFRILMTIMVVMLALMSFLYLAVTGL